MENALLPEPALECSRQSARGRLLAVRQARAAFDGGTLLRAPAFQALLEERAVLLRELAVTREDLLGELHRAVAREDDAARRRALLRAKRDVYNGRRAASSAALPAELREALGGHTRLLEREACLFESRRGAFLDEVAEWAAALLQNEAFLLACRHSSPDLADALERGGSRGSARLPAHVRGMHAYATRFATKANPLHVFAEIVFPPGSGMRPAGSHEMVVDVAAILELERRLLSLARAAGRSWIALSPFSREDGSYRFWVTSARGFDLIALRESELLALVDAFFTDRLQRAGAPTGTWEDCARHLEAHLPAERHARAYAFLDHLARRGIVTEYAVTDPADPAGALEGLSPAYDVLVRAMAAYHLTWTDTAGLRRGEREIAEAARRVPERFSVRCFANSYGSGSTREHEDAAAELFPVLTELKPLFRRARHNFTGHAYLIRAFVRDYLRERGSTSAPYLEVLRHFLRNRGAIVERYRMETHLPPVEWSRATAWEEEAAACHGELTRETIDRLADRAPQMEAGPGSLCFNGPFDYVRRSLFLSNVFAGEGRFVGRYLLGRRAAHCPGGGDAGDGALDVELALPLEGALNYVVRAFATGCGFESRLAHCYRRWVCPSEILVESREDGVVYRHAPSGRPLRIHHRGFQLAQQLPAEYQLLLADHADAFVNPFLGRESAMERGDVRYTPALAYRSVSLRRQRWSFAARLLKETAREECELRFAVRLRDWVQDRMLVGEELWYYRVFSGALGSHKPRFLDLRDPVGALELRRAVRAAPEEVTVSFSPMRPPPEHLFQAGDGAFTTELMIEV